MPTTWPGDWRLFKPLAVWGYAPAPAGAHAPEAPPFPPLAPPPPPASSNRADCHTPRRGTPRGGRYVRARAIARYRAKGGFTQPHGVEPIAARSRASFALARAIAYCQGTLWRNEILERAPPRLGEATEIAAEAIAKRFGRGAVDGKIQAHV